jgi:predicted Fe-S protein YdhL (DUF1289 family)
MSGNGGEAFLDFTPIPAIASPCINVCRIGADGLCEGCRRTLDEIAIWSSASDSRRRAILTMVAERRT